MLSGMFGASGGGAAVPNYTKSLLHFDGSDGSTTFTDQAGRVWTPGGAAQLDTGFAQFGASSLQLDGADSYLSTPESAELSILGDFTVECWIRRTTSGRDAICTKYQSGANGFVLDVGAGNDLRVLMGTGDFLIFSSGATSVPLNTPVHVAAVRSGSDMLVFMEGALVAGGLITGTVANSGTGMYIGYDPLNPDRAFAGHIDEFRFSNVARYTSDFTPAGPFAYPG